MKAQTKSHPSIAKAQSDLAALVAHVNAQAAKPALRTDIRVPFADGTYRFALPRSQMAELERSASYTDKDGNSRRMGIFAIFGRIARGRAFLPSGEIDWQNISVAEAIAGEVVEGDVVSVIRQGLIGGGEGEVDGEKVEVSPARANQLIDAYVVGQPILAAWTLAFAILGAVIYGRAPDPKTGL